MTHLLRELERQEEKLFNCVHCGFCLPACPTYTRLGDEADSPRGRLHFMRAVVEGRIPPDSSAFNRHLGRCLGCRACESVCPSGVEYGRLLEGAREVGARARKPGLLTRTLPNLMGHPRLLSPVMFLTRALRGSGIPGMVARRFPHRGVMGQAKLGMGMVAATAPPRALDGRSTVGKPPTVSAAGASPLGDDSEQATQLRIGSGIRVGILLGCVQEGLLNRVNQATRRVLKANGYQVVEVKGQGCCGAIHSHTGDLEGARALARGNIRAFEKTDLAFFAVNAAGCGAAMKDYPHLLEEDAEYHGKALELAEKIRDISEILAQPGLRIGSSLPMTVTYDAPCHLLHAQGISGEPLDLMGTIPGLELIPLPGSDECCGGAGIYGITHPELGAWIGRDKVQAIRATGARVVATGNPGCMMQIGAGLRMEGSEVDVVHPVELLDESYRRGGFYVDD